MKEMSPFQEVVLVCDECGKKSDLKPRDELVDEGWNWSEFEINEAGIERVAFCSEHFESEKFTEAVEEYKRKRIRENERLDEVLAE